MNKGVTLQADPFTNYDQATINALNDIIPETLLVIVFDLLHEQSLNHRSVVTAYCQAHPGTRVILRPFDQPIMGKWNPIQWCAEMKKRADWYAEPATQAFFEVVPANELNLSVERGGQTIGPIPDHCEDWGDQAAFLQAIAADWQSLGSPYTLHCPALSPSGNYQEGMNQYAFNGVYNDFDVIDLHIYALAQLSDLDNIPSPLAVPRTITEFNQCDPGDFFTRVDGKAEDAVWFLLGGTADQAAYNLITQPEYYQSFKNWTGGSPVPPEPTPSPVEAQIEAQMANVVNALKAIADGKYRGAAGLDGYIVALQGGAPFTGTFEPAPLT